MNRQRLPIPAGDWGLARLLRVKAGCVLMSEAGASLVEMAISVSVYLALFFGIIEICFALYAFNFVNDAAREGARFCELRGANSCTPNASFPNCNLLPTGITSPTNNPVLSYIDTFQYPGLDANNLSATVTWWIASQNANGQTSWTIQCTGAKDAGGNPCNNEGNAVRVVVTYNFPLSIPFWKSTVIPVSSVSQMVINY